MKSSVPTGRSSVADPDLGCCSIRIRIQTKVFLWHRKFVFVQNPPPPLPPPPWEYPFFSACHHNNSVRESDVKSSVTTGRSSVADPDPDPPPPLPPPWEYRSSQPAMTIIKKEKVMWNLALQPERYGRSSVADSDSLNLYLDLGFCWIRNRI